MCGYIQASVRAQKQNNTRNGGYEYEKSLGGYYYDETAFLLLVRAPLLSSELLNMWFNPTIWDEFLRD